jgi:hypothetical protein
MADSDDLSLDAFAARLQAERPQSWGDSLPEDVQTQIIESRTSVVTAVAWLRRIGYEEATPSKIDVWRRRKRAERAEQAERDRGQP